MAKIKKDEIFESTITHWIKVKPSCFVIMPFSKTNDIHTEEYWTNHYEKIIKPLIVNNGLLPHRSEALRGNIINLIINDLVTSPIVVADLTDANPNVYWELGVRQSFRHGTITIAQDGTKLAFDLWAKGTLFYFPNNIIKNTDFEKRFSDALQHCLANPKSLDSHVLEAISGRGTLYQIISKEENIRKLEAITSETIYNVTVLRHIKETCEKNEDIINNKTGTSGKTVTNLLGFSAIENLHINRYLDVEQSFYESLVVLISCLVSANEMINRWSFPLNDDSIEKWFLRNVDDFLEKEMTTLDQIQTFSKTLETLV